MGERNENVDSNGSSVPNYRLLLIGIVLLSVPLLVAFNVSNLIYENISQYLRLFAALGAALIATDIPGLIRVNFPHVRAGGAIGVFVLIYATNPGASVHVHEKEKKDNLPIDKCLQINGLDVQPSEYHSLQEFSEKANLTLKGENYCDRNSADGYYVRFFNPSSPIVTVSPLKSKCLDRIYDPDCWQFESPAPMPFKKGKWETKIQAPSFNSMGRVTGSFSIGWEIRDYDKPVKKYIARKTLSIKIIGNSGF